MAGGGNDPKPSELKQQYGESVELVTEDGSSLSFRILAELTVGGNRYALLQSEAMKEDDEFDVFRIVADPSGEAQLENVTDEEEWELVAEAFDDSQFGSDDQP
ncbi:DUF1292 domain-containing protein [Cohnella lupini]|uniref:Uncharacterized protein DUF1292 n=1 Tax=Cohnella lupini TaxID=1294267 RepID=A0A3D9IV62_9BACL|nr:DUF1292 domain-containing protein [Cohnella lupini]RED65621.1 uncharacterized protein DUF1292 [Cohnella lupini]